MRIIKRMKKAVSGLLALVLLLSCVPMPALAAEEGTCPHHIHDDQCGYVAAVTGADCGHLHSESCNYVAPVEEIPCTCGAQPQHTAECAFNTVEGAACNCDQPVSHADSCNPRDAVAESCSHRCPEDNCGFVQAVMGNDCTYVCEACKAEENADKVKAVQALVNALPDMVTLENKEAVGEQLNALIRAYQSLDEAQQAQVDLTKYDATIAAMHALEGQAGAQLPQTLAAMPNYEIRAYNMDKGTWVLTAGKTGTEFYNKVKDALGYGFDRPQTYITTSRYGSDANKGFFWNTDCQSHTFTDGTYYVYALVVGTDQSRFFQEWIVKVQVRHRIEVNLEDPTGCGGVTNTDGSNMVGGHWVAPGGSLTLRVLDVPGYLASVNSSKIFQSTTNVGNGYKDFIFNNVTASDTITVSYDQGNMTARVTENDSAVNVTASVNGKNRSLPTYLPKYAEYTYTATTTDGSNISEVKANGKTVFSGPANKTVTFDASPEGASELVFTFTKVQSGIVLKSNPSINYRDSMDGNALAKAAFTAAFDTVYPAEHQSILTVENVNASTDYPYNYGTAKVAVYYYYTVTDGTYWPYEGWLRLQQGVNNFGDSDTQRIQIRYEAGTKQSGNMTIVDVVTSPEVTLTLNKLKVTAPKVTKTYDGTAAMLTADKITCTGNVGNASYSFAYVDAEGNNLESAPVNAGTYDVKVTVTDSLGTSTITLEDQITIEPASIENASVTLGQETYTYDATAKTPRVTVTLNGDTLEQGTDYEVIYQDNTNAGTAYVVVIGKGNCMGVASKSFTIEKINPDVIIYTWNDVTYDGSPQMPFTFKLDGKVLTIDKDYVATHGDNINAGDVEVTFSSSNWNGTIKETFNIKPKELTDLTIISPYKVYDGSAVATNASIAFDGVVEQDHGKVQLSADIAYADADADENKAVTASNLKITGEKAGNYCIPEGITKVTGTGTISPMPITVTADDLSKIYGETDPELTWSVSPAVVAGDVLSISISRTAGEDVVENGYPITVSQGERGNPNYEITFKGATFTINTKPLTVDVTVQKQFDNTPDIDKVNDTFQYTLTQGQVLAGDDVILDAYTGTASFASAQVGENIDVTFNGNFTISGRDAGNYTLTQPTDVTGTIYNYYGAFWDFAVSPGGWTNEEVTITAVPGCQLATDINGEWTDKLTCTQEAATVSGNKVAFYVRNANGDISLQKEVLYFIDKTNPTGIIALKNLEPWEELVSNITFGLFFNYEQTVTITCEDALSDVAKIEYLESDAVLDQKDLENLESESWKVYTDPIPVTMENDPKQFVYYAKITDGVGNVTYLSTDGAVYDTTAPVIGIQAGTYYTTQTVEITETNLETLTLNDEEVTAPVMLQGDLDATYTITATDKAGNETTVTVTMKPIASLADAIADLTENNATSADLDNIQSVMDDVTELLEDEAVPEKEKDKLEEIQNRAQNLKDAVEDAQAAIDNDVTQKVDEKTETNVELDDKADLEAAKDTLEDALTDENKGNYTPNEQAEIQQEIDRLEKAIEAIEQTEAVIDAIEKLPSSVEPDLDEADEKAIRDAKDAYDKLTDHQKSLIDKDDQDKLEKLFGILDDYEISKGNGQKWEKDSGKPLVFTANGPDRKFKELRIDGRVVRTFNYTHKDGSTIIILKASYLQNLSTGKHTIQVVYTDGETDGKDYFRIYNSSGNPSTGDNMNLMLFVGMAVTSLLCIAMMFMFVFKRKDKYQR